MLKKSEPPLPEKAAELGSKLRHRRKELGLTLETVAKRAGVTTGFISQVERDITSPSLSSLMAMVDALDAHINDFFDPPPKPEQTSRADMRKMYSSPGGGFDFERLSTSFLGSTLNCLLVHHPAGFEIEEMTHDGEEFYLVMKGALTLVVDNVRTVLGVGDSIHFSSQRPHAVINETSETVTVLVVNTMELFGETTEDEPADG